MKKMIKEGRMMKKIIMLLSLLLFLLPLSTLAHTALTSSNPEAGEVLAQQPEQIELTFGTDIEDGSLMTLQGPNGAIEVGELSISKNMMIGSLMNELENGQYTISWKIIGADGHPIEGEVPFNIEMEAAAEEPVAEEPVVEEPADQPEPEEPTASETAAVENEGESGFLTIGLILLLVVLAGAVILLLVKKKR